MINITYIDDDTCTVSEEVWQYDYGQQVTITGLPSLPTGETTQVHFSNQKTAGAAYAVEAAVQGGAVVADVPDLVLMDGAGSGAVWCFVFVCDADDGETVYRVHFPVIRRPKPNIYNEDKVYEHMFARTIAKVTAAATEASEAVEAAQEVLESIPSDYTELSRRVLALYPTETASGSVVAFDDGADDIPVKSLSVAIEPVQDLHGQANPYPGGGGKNLLDVSGRNVSSEATPTTIYLEACTATKSGENIVATVTGNWSKVQFPLDVSKLVDGETYTASATFDNPSGGTIGIAYYDGAWKGTKATTSKSVKLSVTFTYSVSQTLLRIGYIINNTSTNTGYTVTLSEIQLEKGSTATAYAPYSNICPISGWDTVNVYRTGVNVWDEEWEVGGIDGSGNNSGNTDRIRSKNFIPVVPGKTYYYKTTSNAGLFTWGYNDNKAYVGRVPSNGYAVGNNTVTVPDGVRYIRVVIQPAYGTTYNHDISINYPSTDHDYHAYDGHVYPIPLTSAGTVYGGTLDVTTGVLTVTHGFIASYAGQSLPGAWISDRDVYAAGTTPTTGAQVCYVLATPTTYHLTPTEITTLLGNNTLWSDAGGITLTYRADLQKYFEA